MRTASPAAMGVPAALAAALMFAAACGSGIVHGASGSTTGSSTSSSGSAAGGASASSSGGGGGTGASGSGGASNGSTASSSSSSGDTASSSSSSSASGSSSGGVDAGGLTGSISFEQCVDPSWCGPTGAFTFTALFDFTTFCSTTTVGACVLQSCAMVAGSGKDAGPLKIAGGLIPAGTTVMNQGNGLYGYSAAGMLMMAGQTFTVSGGGAMVTTFGPEAVTAPSIIKLTAPLAPDGGTLPIPTSSDLPVSWIHDQSGAVVTFTLSLGMAPTSLTCTWDATLGQGTVPKALLGQLAGKGLGTMKYGQQNSITFAAGAYTIVESAAQTAGALVTFE